MKNLTVHTLVRTALAGTMLVNALAFAGTARADSDGYIDNFPGIVVVEYDSSALPVPVPSLKQAMDSQWAVLQSQACPTLEQAIGGYNWTCDLPLTGELRAKQLAPNSIGLKYLVKGNHLNFTLTTNSAAGSWADPTGDVWFDAELDITLNAAGNIDGGVSSSAGDYHGQPITIGSAALHLKNVNISTDFVAANLWDLITGFIGKAENKLDQVSANVQGQVQPAVLSLNGLLHDGAHGLGNTIRASTPSSNDYFNVNASVQPTQLVLNFYREYGPPSVPNCILPFTQDLDIVRALTYCVTPPSTDTLGFQRQQPNGVWSAEPSRQSLYSTNAVYNTEVVDQVILAKPGMVMYRVCATNLYGQACTPPQQFVPNFAAPPGANAGPTPGQMPVVNPHKPALQ